MRALGASVGLAVTGVAGPAEQDDVPVGTVFVAVAIAGAETVSREIRLPGQRDQIRQFAVIGALDLLRRQLDPPPPAEFGARDLSIGALPRTGVANPARCGSLTRTVALCAGE